VRTDKEESAQYVAMQELSYADIEPAVYEEPRTPPDQQEASSLLLSDSPVLSLNDLLSFAYQISQAMDFLSSRNVGPIPRPPIAQGFSALERGWMTRPEPSS
ncbi:platelet-derived growth factor receptor beta-like isoform X1, partial [Lates japonicus]